MRVVIVGCGRVGALLAEGMSIEGHEVSVVDRNADSFKRLGKAFRGRAVLGVGFDRATLEKAGLEQADAFASVTSGDNTNIVSALIARDVFSVPKVVARIADPQRADIYRRLGISTISPTVWGANEIREILLYPRMASRYTFGNGEVEMVEILVSQRLAGHSVASLTSPARFQVVSITRLGRALLPVSGTLLEAGDLVYIAVEAGSMYKLEEILST